MKSLLPALVAVATFAVVPGYASAAVSDAVKCQAAKMKLAGQYAFCTLKAEAAALTKQLPLDLTKCQTQYDAKCAKLETKYGSACPTPGDCGTNRAAAQCASDALPTGGGTSGDPVTTPVMDDTPVFFTGTNNQRTVDVNVAFPNHASYTGIVMHFTLSCPAGGCDWFARRGSVAIVQNPGASEVPIELSRFVTPFRVGASWDVDVTDLAPILTGSRTVRVMIDTWVGPGSPNGEGWLVDVSFDHTPGTPVRKPIAVVPVFARQDAVYGDPAQPIPSQVAPVGVAVPLGATSLALRSFVTGHGQGNAGNCAEFCAKDATLTAEGSPTVREIWRSDCTTTAAPGQQGAWQFARGGWCPGAAVNAWAFDVPVPGDGTLNVGYDVEPYENTCRPDAPVCTGCTLGTGCAYDGGNHTEPLYDVSTVMIAYE